jgi:hypothetical protein
MGYYITQMDTQFSIHKSNIKACLDALDAHPQLSRVREDNAEVFRQSLPSGLDNYFNDQGCILSYDDSGNVSHVDLHGEKYREEFDILLQTIAPFVHAGSYIDIAGEDYVFWRWYFDGAAVHELPGIVVYRDPPDTAEMVDDGSFNTEGGSE